MNKKISLVNLNPECRYPKLGLGYLASYLLKYSNNVEVKIHDAAVSENVYNEVSAYNPDIIGVTCLTPEFIFLEDFALKNKKDLNKPIIVGGSHYSLMPKLDDYLDIIVIGEGEQTFFELIENFDGCTFNNKNKINGIMFKNNFGCTVQTPKRQLIYDLDTIPPPARGLFDMNFYGAAIKSDTGIIARETHMMSSRGCPFLCTYCSSSVFWENKIRFHSPEYVVNEIEELVGVYNINSILFFDDLFTINKKRLHKIAELVEERGLNNETTFGCFSRTNTLDKETVDYLKKLNVISVVFGFETGSSKMLNYLKKNTTTIEDSKRSIKLCKDNNIKVAGFFMAGSPFESKEDLEQTINFIESENIDTGWLSLSLPFPKTDFWDYAISNDLINVNNPKWDCFNPLQHHKINEGENPFDDKILLTQEMNVDEFNELFGKIQKALENKSFKYYEKERMRKK